MASLEDEKCDAHLIAAILSTAAQNGTSEASSIVDCLCDYANQDSSAGDSGQLRNMISTRAHTDPYQLLQHLQSSTTVCAISQEHSSSDWPLHHDDEVDTDRRESGCPVTELSSSFGEDLFSRSNRPFLVVDSGGDYNGIDVDVEEEELLDEVQEATPTGSRSKESKRRTSDLRRSRSDRQRKKKTTRTHKEGEEEDFVNKCSRVCESGVHCEETAVESPSLVLNETPPSEISPVQEIKSTPEMPLKRPSTMADLEDFFKKVPTANEISLEERLLKNNPVGEGGEVQKESLTLEERLLRDNPVDEDTHDMYGENGGRRTPTDTATNLQQLHDAIPQRKCMPEFDEDGNRIFVVKSKKPWLEIVDDDDQIAMKATAEWGGDQSASVQQSYLSSGAACYEDETEEETSKPAPKCKSTSGMQADPELMEMEARLWPFLQNGAREEIQLPGPISPQQKSALKKVATEHDLIFRMMGKGRESCCILRKKAHVILKHRAAMEARRQLERLQREMRLAVQRKAEERAALERKNPGMFKKEDVDATAEESKSASDDTKVKKMTCSSEMQADMDVELGLVGPEYTGVLDRDRHRAELAEQRRQRMVERGMQTCAEGFYLCMTCEQDIPEVQFPLHHPHCLTRHRLKMAAAQGNQKPRISITRERQRSRSARGRASSRSKSRGNRTRGTDSGTSTGSASTKTRKASTGERGNKVGELKQLLNKVHDNDVDTLLKAVQHMDHLCQAKKCRRKAKACPKCQQHFCDAHTECHQCSSRAPNNNNNNNQTEESNTQPTSTQSNTTTRKFDREQTLRNLRERMSILAGRRK